MQYLAPEKSPGIYDLLSLKDQNAVVVGGTGLLGGQITYALAELGARIVVASRTAKQNTGFLETLHSKHTSSDPRAVDLDIVDSESQKYAFEEIMNVFDGKIDVLVNCGWSGRKNTLESISLEDWRLDMDVCLNGVFVSVKEALPGLKAARGNILNIASMYGHVAPDYRMYDSEKYANPPSYGAAKAGVIQFTKYLSSFLASDGIRANCISPGPFPFEETQKENPEFMARLGAKNPAGRIGIPHELKGAAALLCSPAGSYMTGQNICVDGGWAIW